MGAWGTGTFENDAALDWLDQEFVRRGAIAVYDTLAAVGMTPEHEYLEVDLGSWGVAAAETVSIAFGNGPEDVFKETLATIEKHSDAIEALPNVKQAALKACARIMGDNSELKQLATEDNAVDDETGAEWLAVIADLQARLKEVS